MKTVDYDHLSNVIMGAMTTIAENQDASTTIRVALLIEFVNFLELMHCRAAVAVASGMAKSEEATPEQNSARSFLDRCIEDFKTRTHELAAYATKQGVLPFNPYHRPTHNEKLRDELLAELQAERDRRI